MNTAGPNIGAFDRLSFTLFIALALHALLIFGITFNATVLERKAPTLDVTLSQHKSQTVVSDEEADFLADADQLGSGTLDEIAQLKTTESADIEENQIYQTTPTLQHIAYTNLNVSHDRIITAQNTNLAAMNQSTEEGTQNDSNAPEEQIIVNNITDVATLKALLDESRQNYANRPRVRTLTAVSAKRAVDAEYIFNWLEKVERIGNQNYPEAARRQRLEGSVGLRVAINADGSLREVNVTRSSGSNILDQAAKQIVYLAAPFPEFNAEMVEDYNVLEIMRTWHFRVDSNQRFSSDG